MGNKIVSGSQSLQPSSIRRSTLQNPPPMNGRSRSTESLCTFISLNSHSDQCLLKERFSHSMEESTNLTTSDFEENLDDTSTLLTTLEGDYSLRDHAVQELTGEKLGISDDLLQKLTTEDWNNLVHFICSSMEQSLQSNILQTVEELREKSKDTNCCSSNNSTTSGSNNTLAETGRDRQSPSPNNDSTIAITNENSHSIPQVPIRHRRSRKAIRPVSMPSSSYQVCPESDAKYIKTHISNHHSNRRSYHQRTSSKSPPAVLENNLLSTKTTISRARASSSPHRVHFGDSHMIPIRRTCSGSSLDEIEIKSKCRNLEDHRGYLTLDQLKDLGLSLQHEPATKKTSERLSSFSMKCWHGDPNNNKDVLRRRPKRRQRKRSMTRKNNEQITSTPKQKPQFEQLCLLGPKTIPSSSPPSSYDNTHNEDDVIPNVTNEDDHLTNSDDSGPDVKHMHHHNHHHYHHFIHHSLSQPNDLCGKSFSQPVHYIISKS